MHFSCIHSDGGFLLSLFHSSLYQISINWVHDKILSFHNWCLLTCSLQCWGQQQSIPAMRTRLMPLLHPHCPTSLVVSSLARGFFSLLPGNLWFQAVPHNQIVQCPSFLQLLDSSQRQLAVKAMFSSHQDLLVFWAVPRLDPRLSWWQEQLQTTPSISSHLSQEVCQILDFLLTYLCPV